MVDALDAPPEAFDETLKIAAYGEVGSRKTLQIGYLIERFGADRVTVISGESGLNTIKSYITRKDQVIVCSGIDDVRRAYVTVAKSKPPRDHWVCLDGMTRVMGWIENECKVGVGKLYDILSTGLMVKDAPEDLRQYGRFITRDGGIEMQQVYGKIGDNSEALLNSFIRLPCNIYANYLEEMTGQSGREKALPWGPDVPGKVGLKAVKSSFDFIIRLIKKDDVTTGYLSGGPLQIAKARDDRNGGVKVPPEIKNFNLADFVQLVRPEPRVAAAAAGASLASK